jgi:hypothetical protein
MNSPFEISQLHDQTGLITLDEGDHNTGSARRAITFIDGEEGILLLSRNPDRVACGKIDFHRNHVTDDVPQVTYRPRCRVLSCLARDVSITDRAC